LNGLVLGIVPARSGSRGIPGKNIRELAGHPLLEYTVRAAAESGLIDRLILSTDSDQIAEVGRSLGLEVPFLRPSALARDDSPMVPVLEHAVAWLEHAGWRPEVVVLLQPTAPLRRGYHIVDAVRLLRSTGCDAVASVVEVPRHYSPDYVMRIADGKLEPFLVDGARPTRRQDARPAYSRDGTVYAVWRDVLVEMHSLYGQDCRPLLLRREESLNLDTLDDWADAEQRLQ
jgi:CMP-N-acetylneuraminic acid synthetase